MKMTWTKLVAVGFSLLMGISAALSVQAQTETAQQAVVKPAEKKVVAPLGAAPVEGAVNINTASAAELAESLNGVGMKKAEAIILWREEHGPFTSKEQLLEVKGIGEVTLAKNSDRILLE